MANPVYVLPNTSEMNSNGRGSLARRRELAMETGCSLIEIPADFIKNGTEVRLTGQPLCEVLTEKAIGYLYESDEGGPNEIACIFHTEPSLPRKDGNGNIAQASLKWHDRRWVIDLIAMLLRISSHLSLRPWAVEIHPGSSDNSYDDIAAAAGAITAAFEKDSYKPRIVLENRTGQFINSGKSISEYWAALLDLDRDLAERGGVVVDIQQLHTANRRSFGAELERIPLACVRGLHIHTKHRVPRSSDDIPWPLVADWASELPNLEYINPEIHHRKHIGEAIRFCECEFQRPDAVL
jgi:hypothetical protein